MGYQLQWSGFFGIATAAAGAGTEAFCGASRLWSGCRIMTKQYKQWSKHAKADRNAAFLREKNSLVQKNTRHTKMRLVYWAKS